MSDQIRGLRMSLPQQHLWRLQRAQPGAVHNAHARIAITGGLDAGRLRSALQTIVQCHELFRAVVRHVPGITMPVLVITERHAVAWRAVDLAGLGPDTQEAQVAQLCAAARSEPIDLERGPLLHATLIALGATRHVLALTLPALCADAWTLNNLVRAICQHYQGGPAEEAAQYFDFSEWHHQLIQSGDDEPGSRYWRQLAALPPTPALPFEHRHQEPPPHELRTLRVAVEQTLASQLDQLAHRSGIAASTWLLACWQTLLARCCGRRDIVVRAVFDGRSYAEFDQIMGVFSRAIPVPMHFSGAAPLQQVAALLNQRISEYAEVQEYFVPDARIPEDPAMLPVDFEFSEIPTAHHAGAITFSPQQYETQADGFKLKLRCVKHAQQLALEFHYHHALFAADAVARMAEGLLTMLGAVAASPAVRWSQAPTMGAAQRRALLHDLNDTAVDYPADRGFHQLFEAQARRTPAQTAVRLDDQRLTYAELNARANQVAHYLRRRGVGADTAVGLATTRSLAMVVGLLGILKAGGAYVPLDPQYPPERLAFIIAETRMPLLLTEQRLTERLPAAPQRICLDTDWPLIAGERSENPASAATPDSLAYVIYTSGSTGQPKGVMIPHRGLTNYLSWCAGAYPLAEGDGAPVHSPLGFDLTVTSLLAPLAVGQQVQLIPESDGIDGLRLRLAACGDLSLIKITPTHLDLLRQQVLAAGLDVRARALVVGGEMLTDAHVAFWQAHAPNTRLVNEYGPTETVVGCCTYVVPAGTLPAGALPIGRPIANTQLYVLDASLEPVPVGVPGELYIGGAGLARGYCGRPDLTAERFVPCPHGAAAGGRMYRTGDLARYLPDGTLELLGRLDQQVKLQGFRIELEEIEAVLRTHPVIREAAVVVRADSAHTQRLVAYLVTDQAPMPGVEELRALLQRKLPPYMIPAVFMRLYALPLTPNGKLDRPALPAPEQARPQLQQDYVAPQTDAERALAAIWQEALNLQRVGIHDNFFTLGGDSIRSVRVVALAQEQGLCFTVQQLFQHPTISGLLQAGALADLEQPDVVGEDPDIAQLLEELAGLSEEEARERLEYMQAALD